MAKRPYKKQIYFAQNFLKDSGLVRRLVRLSGILSSDVVYEIGPGKGIITAELARVAGKVVAIEKDRSLVRRLQRRYGENEKVRVECGDFLQHRIAESDYKIFASIPYNATAGIVRKIIYERPAPAEAYLIMQKEPAKKFSGVAGETLFSLLAKPYVEFRILHRLNRTDFDPVPGVDSVLLRIGRRAVPLIQKEDAGSYRQFVTYGFSRWKPCLRSAFKNVFTYKQWKRMSRDLGFTLDAAPTQLTFQQWLGVFGCFKKLAAAGEVRDARAL